MEWHLRQRAELSRGKVAYDCFGDGPPVVLVHGSPSWSYLWREVAPTLAQHFAVYVFDLLGYGDSEKREGQDVSIAAQANILTQLLEVWQLDSPSIVGHDIGGAILLRAHLCQKSSFSRIALIDAVVFNPWNTPLTMHIRNHLDAYTTMPSHVYEQIVTTHLHTAVYHPMDDETLVAYLSPWRGREGMEAYFRKIAQIDEGQTAVLEPLLGSITIPTLIIWGEKDEWISPSLALRLHQAIPRSTLKLIPNAGHFAMEDRAEEVAEALVRFLTD
jgi:pimeloyl-ACP methyl ester carboxylesterase